MPNIIITGASKGIGFETVLELAIKAENSILAISRWKEGLDQLEKIAFQLNPDARLKTIVLDLCKEGSEVEILPYLQSFFNSKVHILINNAAQIVNKPFLKTSAQDFERLLQINLLAPFRLIQFLFPFFTEDWGHIVNIGSMGGFQGSLKFSGLSAYSATKGGLHSLTECLGEELKETPVRINALALGSVQTEMVEEAFPGYLAPVLAYEMGSYIAHFALTGHSFFNGKIIPVALTNP